MNTTFEQPKHLTFVCYRRLVRVFQPVLVFFAVVMSALVLIGLGREVKAGNEVSIWRWMIGATSGLWGVFLILIGLRFAAFSRRYIEFRDDGVFLALRGVITYRRIVAWSLSPDSIEPRYARLRLTYRFGLGRKHWSMLLEDAAQISQLREALTLQVPGTNIA